jgi:hypothetical protein
MHNKTIFYFLISSDFHYLRWDDVLSTALTQCVCVNNPCKTPVSLSSLI